MKLFNFFFHTNHLKTLFYPHTKFEADPYGRSVVKRGQSVKIEGRRTERVKLGANFIFHTNLSLIPRMPHSKFGQIRFSGLGVKARQKITDTHTHTHK